MLRYDLADCTEPANCYAECHGRYLIRFGEAEHAFCYMAQDQLRADRGDAGDLDLSEVALDVVFAGVAHAAMSHHRRLAGAEPGLRGAVFCGICIGPGFLAAVVSSGCAQYHQFGRLELDPPFGKW